MLGMQKRLVKKVAGTLSAIMISSTFLPLAAYAAPPPPPPPPPPGCHDMHYHSHGGKMNTAAIVVGLAATIGIIALLKHQTRIKIPSDPMSYDLYRKDFVNGLNAWERTVYNEMIKQPVGEHKTVYTNRETLKTIKKICKKLPHDFKYAGTTSVKEPDGSVTKYICIQRLGSESFSSNKVAAASFA